MIVLYFKVANSSIFHSIISADRAFIVDILLNRANSDLVILAKKKRKSKFKIQQNSTHHSVKSHSKSRKLLASIQQNFPPSRAEPRKVSIISDHSLGI